MMYYDLIIIFLTTFLWFTFNTYQVIFNSLHVLELMKIYYNDSHNSQINQIEEYFLLADSFYIFTFFFVSKLVVFKPKLN